MHESYCLWHSDILHYITDAVSCVRQITRRFQATYDIPITLCTSPIVRMYSECSYSNICTAVDTDVSKSDVN